MFPKYGKYNMLNITLLTIRMLEQLISLKV